MKKYFKINEISKLFGIGPDSLRYYEKIGLIKPKRDKNNYRQYTLSEIYQLNIISELRKLQFPLEKIKKYLEDLSLSNTLSLLDDESSVIEEQINRLKIEKNLIDHQINFLKKYETKSESEFSIKTFPNRYILELETSILLDEEFDFSIRVLQMENNFTVNQFQNNFIGASLSLKDFKENNPIEFNSVFIIQDKKTSESQKILNLGKYLCLSYRGPYTKLRSNLKLLKDYTKKNNLNIDNTLYEIYLIDNRYTAISKEYLTEIQVKIL